MITAHRATKNPSKDTVMTSNVYAFSTMEFQQLFSGTTDSNVLILLLKLVTHLSSNPASF